MSIEMELVGVRVQMPTSAPILLLRETSGRRRTVPIYIGGPEAHAIDLALSGTITARPMTHDLIILMLEMLEAKLDRIELTELRDGTFHSDLVLTSSDGAEMRISSRPSDAVALAVRVEVPIFAAEELVDEAGIEAVEGGGEDEEQMIEELRRFLDGANPDDFAS